MPSVTIDTTVDIDASKDTVWRGLTDFPRYDEWNPSMRIEGTPEVGTKLVVHLNADGGHGVTFRPKVLAATPGEDCDGSAGLVFAGSPTASTTSS